MRYQCGKFGKQLMLEEIDANSELSQRHSVQITLADWPEIGRIVKTKKIADEIQRTPERDGRQGFVCQHPSDDGVRSQYNEDVGKKIPPCTVVREVIEQIIAKESERRTGYIALIA